MERLQDNQQVKEYFRMLQENDRQRQAGKYRALLEQINNLEWQLETVGKELKSLRGQLAKEDRGSVERGLETAARRVGREVKAAKEHIQEIKRSILSGMEKAVREAKRSGAAALDKAVDKLHIRVMLRNISMGMERSSIHIQETIDRITAASRQSQEANIHKKNAARALFGKEQEKVPEKLEMGAVARNTTRSFAMVKGICDEIRKQADGLEERIVRLSGRVETDREENVNVGQEANIQEQAGMRKNKGVEIPHAGRMGVQRKIVQGETMDRPQTVRMLREYTVSHRQSGRPYEGREKLAISDRGRN